MSNNKTYIIASVICGIIGILFIALTVLLQYTPVKITFGIISGLLIIGMIGNIVLAVNNSDENEYVTLPPPQQSSSSAPPQQYSSSAPPQSSSSSAPVKQPENLRLLDCKFYDNNNMCGVCCFGFKVVNNDRNIKDRYISLDPNNNSKLGYRPAPIDSYFKFQLQKIPTEDAFSKMNISYLNIISNTNGKSIGDYLLIPTKDGKFKLATLAKNSTFFNIFTTEEAMKYVSVNVNLTGDFIGVDLVEREDWAVEFMLVKV
jgi:hypothetical protein